MNEEQQAWAAGGIVGFTAFIFLLRLLKKKKGGSCGSGCGCSKPGKPHPPH